MIPRTACTLWKQILVYLHGTKNSPRIELTLYASCGMEVCGVDVDAASCESLQDRIKQVFEKWKDNDPESTVLSTHDCETLLKDHSTCVPCDTSETLPVEDAASSGTEAIKRPSWQDYCDGFIPPYPEYPLYKTLAQILRVWMKTGHCPVSNLPALDLLEEGDHVMQRKDLFASLAPLVLTLNECLEEAPVAQNRLTDIIRALGKRGLMDLLGMRQTVGSIECFPPSRTQLEQSFNQPNRASSKLTVGARALAKHCHRDQSSSWWGQCTGSEQAKNEHAVSILNRILDQAAWINIHMLPHDVTTVEVRSPEGYGARWSSDGTAFRGFLEPQMADGHEVGWKH